MEQREFHLWVHHLLLCLQPKKTKSSSLSLKPGHGLALGSFTGCTWASWFHGLIWAMPKVSPSENYIMSNPWNIWRVGRIRWAWAIFASPIFIIALFSQRQKSRDAICIKELAKNREERVAGEIRTKKRFRRKFNLRIGHKYRRGSLRIL